MADKKDLAYQDYLNGMKYKDIAEKYGVTINTVKSWKTRYKWSRDGVHTQEKSVHTKNKEIATKKQNKKTDEEPVIENDELTDKQRLFCIYYVKYFNATKAYQKAYGCAYTTAMVEGHRHLRNPKISSEIDRLRNEMLTEKKVSANEVLQKYIDIAFADITDFVEFGRETVTDAETGMKYEVNRVKFKESIEVDGTIITEVKQGKDGASVKLADKMKALEFLAKYTDLLSDNDKKRLQEEKLKMDIEKTKAEIDNLANANESSSGEDWVEALKKVAEKRRLRANE